MREQESGKRPETTAATVPDVEVPEIRCALLSLRLRFCPEDLEDSELACLQGEVAASVRFVGEDWWRRGGKLAIGATTPGYEVDRIEIGRGVNTVWPERAEDGTWFLLPAGKIYGDQPWLLHFRRCAGS